MTSDNKQGLGRAPEKPAAKAEKSQQRVIQRGTVPRGQESISIQSKWCVQRLIEEPVKALTDAGDEEWGHRAHPED